MHATLESIPAALMLQLARVNAAPRQKSGVQSNKNEEENVSKR